MDHTQSRPGASPRVAEGVRADTLWDLFWDAAQRAPSRPPDRDRGPDDGWNADYDEAE